MDNIFANLFRFRQREATQVPVGGAPGVPSSTMPKESAVTGGSYQERIVYARSPETALTVSKV